MIRRIVYTQYSTGFIDCDGKQMKYEFKKLQYTVIHWRIYSACFIAFSKQYNDAMLASYTVNT